MSMAWMLRIVVLAGLAPVLLLGQLLFEQSTKDNRFRQHGAGRHGLACVSPCGAPDR
jgi:hypothetical protein